MITITIATDNAAFEDGHKAPEVARILRALADRIAAGYEAIDYSLRDINGNTVGSASEDANGDEITALLAALVAPDSPLHDAASVSPWLRARVAEIRAALGGAR